MIITNKKVEICVEIFFVRNSKMVGREHYFYKELLDESNADIILDFIKQYYIGREILPSKIMCKYDIEDKDVIELLLTQQSNKKVEIKTPQKGEKLIANAFCKKNGRSSSIINIDVVDDTGRDVVQFVGTGFKL